MSFFSQTSFNPIFLSTKRSSSHNSVHNLPCIYRPILNKTSQNVGCTVIVAIRRKWVCSSEKNRGLCVRNLVICCSSPHDVSLHDEDPSLECRLTRLSHNYNTRWRG